MKWLERLKTESTPGTHATKATKPGFVGSVAYTAGALQNFTAPIAAANDVGSLPAIELLRTTPSTQTVDPDRWCWPHSSAMNTAEIDTFTRRLALFTDKGLSLEDGELQADQLVTRDRDDDDRRLCLECVHLQGVGRWRCGNWARAGIAQRAADCSIGGDFAMNPQRCPGFASALQACVTRH